MMNRELHLIGKNEFEVRETESQFTVDENEVLIKIISCGICGTDLTYAYVSEHTPENSIVLGHEFCCVIEKVGSQVTALNIGDIVVADPGINCKTCEHCLNGNPNLCKNPKFFGYPPFNGGFQQRLVFPAEFSFKMSSNIDPITAVLIEPLAVCLHSLNLSKIKYGMDAVVFGAGPIGLILVKLLKTSGVSKIFVSEPIKKRRELAIEFGADFVIDPSKDDLVACVMNNTENNGVARVFEASGSNEAITATTKVAKSGGSIIMIGIPKNDDFNISHSEARKKGLTIKMERTINNTILTAIKLIEQGFDISKLITHKFSLDEAANSFKDIQNYKLDSIKCVVVL
jgi:L-iditol 2-dehydrogenase